MAENESTTRTSFLLGENLAASFSNVEQRKNGPRIICVSGLPGAGKTALVERLVGITNGLHIPEFLEPISSVVTETRFTSPFEIQLRSQRWIIEQHRRKAEMARSASPGTIVVQDRGVVDGLVYTSLYDPQVLRIIEDEVESYEWPQALSVILVADDDTIKQRLVARDNIVVYGDRQEFIQGLREKYVQIASIVGIPVIDTSRLSTEEVCHLVMDMVRSLGVLE